MAGGIPEDVLFEILIRLPVKSLCRFRSVCPLWLSIISDPYFIRCHYSHSKTRTRLLVMNSFLISRWNWLIYDADHMELDHPELVRAGECMPSCDDPMPSVHGLICLPLKQGDISILNPSTGENILISQPQVTRGYRERYYFGFDPVSEKHKVFYTYQTPEQYLEQWVYTLGSVEKWRRVGVLNCHHRKLNPYDGQVCIDGILYFLLVDHDLGFNGLASFDLKSESFQMVELSLPGEERIGMGHVLIEFNGSVALVDRYVYDSDPRINVWAMEDFHKQVWKKRSFLVPDSCWETHDSENALEFGCTLHGGELLAFTPFRPDQPDESGYRDWFSWNTVINDFRRSRIQISEGDNRFNWTSYHRYSDHVESLLPLKAP